MNNVLREKCIRIVNNLPTAVLAEAEEELLAIRDHYLSLQATKDLPPSPVKVIPGNTCGVLGPRDCFEKKLNGGMKNEVR